MRHGITCVGPVKLRQTPWVPLRWHQEQRRNDALQAHILLLLRTLLGVPTRRGSFRKNAQRSWGIEEWRNDDLASKFYLITCLAVIWQRCEVARR